MLKGPQDLLWENVSSQTQMKWLFVSMSGLIPEEDVLGVFYYLRKIYCSSNTWF